VELHSIMPRLSLLKPPLNGREGSVIRGSIFDAILGGKWVTFKCNSTGTVTAEVAKAFALTEFEKFRVVQDRLFRSDFDELLHNQPKVGSPK
ncbi:MAG: hypothetical protein Q7W55_08695, partial [Pseudohongiella sp.]|nr:hypothetical protein [Pseudohongiella sp.]